MVSFLPFYVPPSLPQFLHFLHLLIPFPTLSLQAHACPGPLFITTKQCTLPYHKVRASLTLWLTSRYTVVYWLQPISSIPMHWTVGDLCCMNSIFSVKGPFLNLGILFLYHKNARLYWLQCTGVFHWAYYDHVHPQGVYVTINRIFKHSDCNLICNFSGYGSQLLYLARILI